MSHSPNVLILAIAVVTGCSGSRAGEPESPHPGSGPAVEADDIAGIPAAQVEDHMVGRFPGVRIIHHPGGGFSVRVWGPGTIRGSQEPLYVVDGVPVRVDPGRGLYWLNPGDVAAIQVLKDISETSAWGVRGGNGVVVITTKRGDDGGA